MIINVITFSSNDLIIIVGLRWSVVSKPRIFVLVGLPYNNHCWSEVVGSLETQNLCACRITRCLPDEMSPNVSTRYNSLIYF